MGSRFSLAECSAELFFIHHHARRVEGRVIGTTKPIARLLPADVLDVRTREAFTAQPTERAANIPVAELRQRPYELPPTGASVVIANTGREATKAAALLIEMGRNPELVAARGAEPYDDRYRLWSATSLLENAESVPPGRALCLACGVGREAVTLAAAGWRVVAVDILSDAIERGRKFERAYAPAGSSPIRWLVADLRQPLPDDLGEFALITQFFYADSNTADRISQHLTPSGVALIESFSERHWRALGRSKPNSILRPQDWDPTCGVAHVEGWHDGRHTMRLIVCKNLTIAD